MGPLLWGYGNNAFKRITWQLISKFLYSLLVRLTRRSSNAILGPVVTCKLSFPLCDISHRQFTLAKTYADNCNTYLHLQTDSGRFAFCFCGPRSRHQESYMYLPVPRLCKERGQKLPHLLLFYSCELWPCMSGTLSRNLIKGMNKWVRRKQGNDLHVCWRRLTLSGRRCWSTSTEGHAHGVLRPALFILS